MSNVLLTVDMIMRRNLMVLENNLVAAKFVNRQYDDSYANSGAKIGASVRIRIPPRTVVTKSVTFVAQDQVEEYTTLTVDKQHHVGMSFTQQELTLQIDDFSERFIEPAMASLANDIDQTVLAEYWNFYNAVGTPGTTPGSSGGAPTTAAAALFVYGSAMAKMDYEAVSRDSQRAMIVEPIANVMLVSALAGLFNPTSTIEEHYTQGTMGGGMATFGAKFSMDQNVATHVVGNLGGTPLCDGVGVEAAATLVTKGWTNTSLPRLKHGDIFTIANVYAVNPQTRASTGQLRQFVVTADCSDTAGAITIPISPTLTSTGARQTISALPADNAALTILGAAATNSPQNLLLHKDAITLACVDLENPNGYGAWGGRIASKKLGISMTMARQYDISTTAFKTRIDVLFGVRTVRPQLGVRVVG
jgi:hypothetical protein